MALRDAIQGIMENLEEEAKDLKEVKGPEGAYLHDRFINIARQLKVALRASQGEVAESKPKEDPYRGHRFYIEQAKEEFSRNKQNKELGGIQECDSILTNESGGLQVEVIGGPATDGGIFTQTFISSDMPVGAHINLCNSVYTLKKDETGKLFLEFNSDMSMGKKP